MKARWLFPLLLVVIATVASATNMDSLGLSSQRYMMGTPTAPAIALGTPTPGNVRYCNNCNTGNPCTAGGTGAVAKADGTAWNCGAAAGSGVPGGSSGNLQTNDGSGGFGAYAGATCPTPGFPISSSASGGWTCATPVPPTPAPTATPQSVAGGGSIVPYDEGTPVPTPVGGAVDCKGSLITCADDATTHRTNITITAPTPVPTATPGAGGGSSKLFMSWSANQAILPASSYPQFGVNNNHMVLLFDQSADECAYFEGILPTGYAGGGLKVRVDWNANGATSTAVGWLTAFERMDSTTAISSDSFGTQKSVSTTTTGTALATNQSTTTHSSGEIDSLAAGEGFRLRLCRDGDGSVVTDSLLTDAQMNHVSVEEP